MKGRRVEHGEDCKATEETQLVYSREWRLFELWDQLFAGEVAGGCYIYADDEDMRHQIPCFENMYTVVVRVQSCHISCQVFLAIATWIEKVT